MNFSRNHAFRSVVLVILLATLCGPAVAEEATAPASADLFEREALKLLKASFENKRGVVVHVGGQSIAGVVKAIGPDAVVLANREYSNIVVRREKIDAIESP